VGLSFHWDAFDIEGMVHEKTVSANFGVAVGPRLQTPGTGAAMPSHKEFQRLEGVGPQAANTRALRLPCPGCWGQTCAPGCKPRRANLQNSAPGV